MQTTRKIQPTHPLITRLADLIEATWQEYFVLEPYELPSDLGYVEGQLEGDRLTILNRCHRALPFRKLHLELATVGAGLDILHCVMYPRPDYDLPILGTDIVANPQLVSAAIIDLSPVGDALPAVFLDGLAEAYARRTGFSQLRALPEWGTIFSPRCLFVRVVDAQEADLFLDLCRAYLRVYCEAARTTRPAPASEHARLLAGHRRYCQQQQQNDKTRRILEKAFGADWAERYMRTVLFDAPDAG